MSLPKTVAEVVKQVLPTLVGKAAKAKKKKVKGKASRGGGPSLMIGQAAAKIHTVPVQVGVSIGSRPTRHQPFRISGHVTGPSFGLDSSGVLDTFTADGTFMAYNSFDVDIIGNSSASNNFAAFPSVIRQLAQCFTRYRFVRLSVRYLGTCPTTTPGLLVMGVVPEVVSGGGVTVPSSTVRGMQVSMATSAWAPATLNLLAPGGLRSDWLYSDNAAGSTQAELRGETAGTFAWSTVGAATPATGVTMFGTLQIEYEVEFDGLALETSFTARPKRVAEEDYLLVPTRRTLGPSSLPPQSATSTAR